MVAGWDDIHHQTQQSVRSEQACVLEIRTSNFNCLF